MSGKIKVGLIRVLTTQDKKLLKAHGKLIEDAFPRLETINRCIEDQPEGIHDPQTMKVAVPKIVRLGPRLEAEGAKVIIVSCADDPGVEELRRILKVPIIGAGSATAALSLVYGNKIGTLAITEETPEAMKRILGKHLVAEAKPEGVQTTLDLMKEEGKRNAFEAAEKLKKKGAQVIALGCTGYSTIGIAPELKKRVGLPVIDPVIASGLFAWHAATIP